MTQALCATTQMPKVSIAMGVYNAQQFVGRSIESILNQDYPHFELIISDNGSQDRSGDICRAYADRDNRIIYRRHPTNINPLENSTGMLEMSTGQYHVWAADHDVYHPQYLSSLLNQFRCAGDSVVLCYSDIRRIDMNDKPLSDVSEDADTRGLTSVERFKKVMWGLSYCSPIFGLYRMSALKKAWKLRTVTGADRVFLPEFTLMGEYVHHKETLFFMRQNRKEESCVQNKKRQSKLYVPNIYEAIVPTVMRDYELIKIAHDSNLNNAEKVDLVEEILRWHNADPYALSRQEVQDLVSHGMDLLNSSEKSRDEKLSAACEYLRIAGICRIFCPSMGPKLDRLIGLCNEIAHTINPGAMPVVNDPKSQYRRLTGGDDPCREENMGVNSSAIGSQPEKSPLVSIGMTVFNQMPYVQKTIESILAQNYQHFELIIADNASDDGSREFCEHYAKRDHRIKLIKNEHNIGKLANLDMVLKSSTGKFFLWASGHDLFHLEYLSTLVEEFNANDDSVVLCCPGTVFIDEKNNLFQPVENSFVDTRHMRSVDRFLKIIKHLNPGYIHGGLYRTSSLKQVWKPYVMRGAEQMIAAQLSMIGTIAQVRDQLFYKRKMRHTEDAFAETHKCINAFSLSKHEALIPFTMFAFEHINLVTKSALDEQEKAFLIEEVRKCFLEKFGLQNEAIRFLQKGTQWVKSDLQQLHYLSNCANELVRLSKICMLFNYEYKHGLERFGCLVGDLVQNH